MTGELSKKFHGVGIGPLSKILAVNRTVRLIESAEYVLHSAYYIHYSGAAYN